MTYLFDNNISVRFAHMLKALGVDALAEREVLPEASEDTEILEWLQGTDRVLITGDRHIRTRPLEAEALKRAGVTTLFLDRFWSKMGYWQQAAWLLSRWEEIDRFASNAAPGTCAKIQQRGRIRLL